jgi:hypothetical protein
MLTQRKIQIKFFYDVLCSDFYEAFEYGITDVPILVANKKYKLVEAQKYEK